MPYRTSERNVLFIVDWICFRSSLSTRDLLSQCLVCVGHADFFFPNSPTVPRPSDQLFQKDHHRGTACDSLLREFRWRSHDLCGGHHWNRRLICSFHGASPWPVSTSNRDRVYSGSTVFGHYFYTDELTLAIFSQRSYCGLNIIMGIYNVLPTKALDSMFKYWSKWLRPFSTLGTCRTN